jgi:hypothetical protein
MTDLWLKISVNVPKLVKLVDTHEHFRSIKLGVFLLENTRVIEQRTEISSWDVFLDISLVPDSLSRQKKH